MSTRRLGNSDLNITPIGFGAWAIGGTGYDFAWGKQDDADSIAAIHRSLALGVNWIDTAPVYGTGHSEEIVASELKEWRGSRPAVPGIVQYTSDILFRDLWLRPDLAPRDRSLATVSALVATGQVARIPYHLNRRWIMA